MKPSSYQIDLDSIETVKPTKPRSRTKSSDIEKTFDDIAYRNHLRSPETDPHIKNRETIGLFLSPNTVNETQPQPAYNESKIDITDPNVYTCAGCSKLHYRTDPYFPAQPKEASPPKSANLNHLRSSWNDLRSSVDSIHSGYPQDQNPRASTTALVNPPRDQHYQQAPKYQDLPQYQRAPKYEHTQNLPKYEHTPKYQDRSRPSVSTTDRDYPFNNNNTSDNLLLSDNKSPSNLTELESLRNSVTDLASRLNDLRASADPTRFSDTNLLRGDDGGSVSSRNSYHGTDRHSPVRSLATSPSFTQQPESEEVRSLRASIAARDRQLEALKNDRLKPTDNESSYEQALRNERRLFEERKAQQELQRLKSEQDEVLSVPERQLSLAQEALERDDSTLDGFEPRLIATHRAQDEHLRNERRLEADRVALLELERLKAGRRAQEQELERLRANRLAQHIEMEKLKEAAAAKEDFQRMIRARSSTGSSSSKTPSKLSSKTPSMTPSLSRSLTRSLTPTESEHYHSEDSSLEESENSKPISRQQERVRPLEFSALDTTKDPNAINVRRQVPGKPPVRGKVEPLKPPSASVWLDSGDLAFTHSFGPGHMGLMFEYEEVLGLNVVTQVTGTAATYGIRIGDYIVQTNEQDLAGYDDHSNGFEGVEVVLEAAEAVVAGEPGVFSLSDEALCEVLIDISRPVVITFVRPCDKSIHRIRERQERAKLAAEEEKLLAEKKQAEEEKRVMEEAIRLQAERAAEEEQEAEYALMRAELSRKNAQKLKKKEKEMEEQRLVEEERERLEHKRLELVKETELHVLEREKLEQKRQGTLKKEPKAVHFDFDYAEEEAKLNREREAREKSDQIKKEKLEAQIREHERKLQEEIEKEKEEEEKYAMELELLEKQKKQRMEAAKRAHDLKMREEQKRIEEEERQRAAELKDLEEKERAVREMMRKKCERDRSELAEKLKREKTEEEIRVRELKVLEEKEARAFQLMQNRLDRDRASLEETQERDRLEEEVRNQEAQLQAELDKQKLDKEMQLQELSLREEREARAYDLMRRKRARDKANKAALLERERLKRESEEAKQREARAYDLMRQKRARDKAKKASRLEQERLLKEAEEDKKREERTYDLLRRKRARDKANKAALLERERLKKEAEEAAAIAAVEKEAEKAQRKLRKKQRKLSKLDVLEKQRDEEEEKDKKSISAIAEEESNQKKIQKAKLLMLRKLRGNKTVRSVPRSSHTRSQSSSQKDFLRLKQKNTNTRLELIRGMAELRRPLTKKQLLNIDSVYNLVYMWPLEDGNKLTEKVKPWPCTVTDASIVKLTMPRPCGRTFAENEKAWGLVFNSFINSPGTPFRKLLKFTEDRKLTAGTSYMASAQEAHVIRIPKDNKDFIDVEYLFDTDGKPPQPGQKSDFEALTELAVPIGKIFSKEENQEIFVGATVRVTKVVQRTFEFITSEAAYTAMETLIKNTPNAGPVNSDDEFSDESSSSDSDSDSDDSEDEMDSRFGLEHGGCLFKVSRPLTVKLEGLEEYDLIVSDAWSVRIASKDDEAPIELPFPESSCWGGKLDPAKITKWDPKVLKSEGMPLRFVNHRKHCSVMYKICNLVDIDKPEAAAIKAENVQKHTRSRRLSRGDSFGISSRFDDDVLMDLETKKKTSSTPSSSSLLDDDISTKPLVVYVRPGETAWVRAPPGVYHLRLCEGRKWFGDEYKFGPSGIVMPRPRGAPRPEPFSNYVLSLWRYPTLWLYRSRVGRWLITPEDPSVALTPHDEAPKDEDEEERLRDLYINDVGTFRTKKKRLEWPHDELSKGNWENHKGIGCALADSDDEDSVLKMWPIKLWSPFKGMSVQIDNEAYSLGTPRAMKRNNSMDPVAGPAAFWVSGLPSIVEDKGAFLRMAHKSNFMRRSASLSAEEAKDTFDGLASLEKPFRIHGKPVFRFDPRYDFLRGLYNTPELDEYDDEDHHDEEVLERGRAGPDAGAWWLNMRDSCHDAGTFAKEVLDELDQRDGAESEFFSIWSAAIFEVPDKRIRTVLWPQSSEVISNYS